MPRPRRVAFATTALLVALCLPLTPHVERVLAAPSSATGLLIPLYSVPGPSWESIIQEKEAYPLVPMTVIINPSNGPGRSWDQEYNTWVDRLEAAGVNVLGYVYTEYGNRSITAVEEDITAYAQWYWVTGIFLDQMASSPGYESYFSALTQYCHALGLSTVVGNPGTILPSSYRGTVDVVVMSENPSVPTMGDLVSGTVGENKSGFALIAYGIDQLSAPELYVIANYVGELYVTDATGPNPYDVLPSYFATLVAELSSFDASPAIIVQSTDAAGAPIGGMNVTVSTGNATVAEGATPFVVRGTPGTLYTVTIGAPSPTKEDSFVRWQDGGQNQSLSLILTASTNLTAVFSTPWLLRVLSTTTSDVPLEGVWATIYSGTRLVASGFTPLNYTATEASTYVLCVTDGQDLNFSGWSDGQGTSCRFVSYNANTTLVATYIS